MRRSVLGFLIVLVLFAGCVPAPMYQQAVQNSQLYEQMNQQLQAEVAADQVKIQQLQDQLKVTMLNEILFPEGGYEIHQKGKRRSTRSFRFSATCRTSESW